MSNRRQSDEHTRTIFAWLNQVKADTELPASAFKVAYEISQYLSRTEGDAWPSCRTIGEGIGLSESTVIDMVSRLHRLGHLDLEPGRQGRGHSNRYRLNLKPQPAKVSDPGKPQPAEVCRDQKPQPAEVCEDENLGRLGTKPWPAKENHLNEPSESNKVRVSRLRARSANGAAEPEILPPSHVDAGFAEFWAAYPRQVAKGAARKEFAKAVKRATAADIVAGAERYAAERANENPRYTAHPATWLRADRWLDEPAPPHMNAGSAYLLAMRSKQR